MVLAVAGEVEFGFGSPGAGREIPPVQGEELERLVVAMLVPSLDGCAKGQIVSFLAFLGMRVPYGFGVRRSDGSKWLAEVACGDEFSFRGGA